MIKKKKMKQHQQTIDQMFMPKSQMTTPNNIGIILDKHQFDLFIDKTIAQQTHELAQLLLHSTQWKASDEFKQALFQECTLLAHRVIQRASVFADYRVTSNASVKKNVMVKKHIKESDFSLAWQSLEADAAYQ